MRHMWRQSIWLFIILILVFVPEQFLAQENTETPTIPPTATLSPTETATLTATATASATLTGTASPTVTDTATVTLTATNTISATDAPLPELTEESTATATEPSALITEVATASVTTESDAEVIGEVTEAFAISPQITEASLNPPLNVANIVSSIFTNQITNNSSNANFSVNTMFPATMNFIAGIESVAPDIILVADFDPGSLPPGAIEIATNVTGNPEQFDGDCFALLSVDIGGFPPGVDNTHACAYYVQVEPLPDNNVSVELMVQLTLSASGETFRIMKHEVPAYSIFAPDTIFQGYSLEMTYRDQNQNILHQGIELCPSSCSSQFDPIQPPLGVRNVASIEVRMQTLNPVPVDQSDYYIHLFGDMIFTANDPDNDLGTILYENNGYIEAHDVNFYSNGIYAFPANTAQFESAPEWSPDSNRILYSRDGILYLTQSSWNSSEVIAQGTNPDWSSDGKIAFEYDGNICILQSISDTNPPDCTMIQNASSPSWGLGSTWLAYERDGSVYLTDRVSGGTSDFLFLTGATDPEWSPDDDWIAMSHNSLIAVLSPYTGEGSYKSNTLGGTQPTWSPDSEFIAFVRNGQQIDVVGLTVTGVQTVTTNGSNPVWGFSPVEGVGGGGNPDLGFPNCGVYTNGGQSKNLRSNHDTNSDIIAYVPSNTEVYILQAPTTNQSGTWYYIKYEEYWGWLSSVTLDLSNIGCTEGISDPTQLPAVAPTPTPTPTPIPPPNCIEYERDGGVLTFKPVNPAHEASQFRNLLPPCNINGGVMAYDGINIQPDSRFDRQYDVMNEDTDGISAAELETIRDLHYGPDDTTPIVTPRPVPDNPDPNLWDNPTEETRRLYETNLIRSSDNNSCGFVTIGYAMNGLGISTPANVHPYQLMMSATTFDVDLTQDGFGWWHFLDEVNHGIQQGTNAFPEDDANVDAIIDFVGAENTTVMVLVRIELGGGFLTPHEDDISHWVLVTGVSEDGNWFRILNPLNNRVEYYNRTEFEQSRNAGYKDIIRITNPS